MTTSIVQSGSQIASDILDSSRIVKAERLQPRTLSELLDQLAEEPPKTFPMLRSTCSVLATYLNQSVTEISIDSVNESRDGFRPFLEARPYAETSVKTYVNHVRILLQCAKALGWKPDATVPQEWRAVMSMAKERKCADVVRYLMRTRKTPFEVTIEDADDWADKRVQKGMSFPKVREKKGRFWRVLRDCGRVQDLPISLLRENNYGIPMDQFPEELKSETNALLKWKQAAFALDRPKNGKHRPVTSKRLKDLISGLFGFSSNIRGMSGITSLPQLAQREIIGDYVEWCLNERAVKGDSIVRNLRLLSAAMRHHPSYQSLDLRWFKTLLDNIPIEEESERRRRKAAKYLEYRVIESIPANIHSQRVMGHRKTSEELASLAMDELLIRWLVALPWRQRNIRECRIKGQDPNVFKGRIPPYTPIDKPEWVQMEEQRNPDAEFWQFRFSKEETKTKRPVHAILPRPLVGPLEEYLERFRNVLIREGNPDTLFVNHDGTPLQRNSVTTLFSELTLRHGGRRVTPHLFRDIVAFAWLKEHPKDYLTLSKILWHSNINETIKTYGSRFDESSGVCAMETWLEEREARSR